MNTVAIESIIFLVGFFYALTHQRIGTAVLMGASLLITGRGRWLLRAFIAVLLIALLHDALTGQLASDLK